MSRRTAVGLVLATAVSCTGLAPSAQAVHPPAAPAPELPWPVVAVELVPRLGPDQTRLAPEMVGLTTTLLELGLAELSGVVPRVRGQAISVSLQDAWDLTPQHWEAEVSLTGTRDAPTLHLNLCRPSGACSALESQVLRGSFAGATAALLEGASRALGRQPVKGALARWRADASVDPYAEIVCGRAAATRMGLLPEVPADRRGDVRRDPMIRAVAIDPAMSLGHWLLARRALELGDTKQALASLVRARELSPGRLLYRTDEAKVLDLAAASGALDGWTAVAAAAGAEDPRFRLGHARSLAASGQLRPAVSLLNALPVAWRDAVPVLVLRVQIADAGGPVGDLDALLARWQRQAPTDPVPVRRRIMLRVRNGRYEEAMAFVSALEASAPVEEVRHVGLALALSAHHYPQAERWAAAAGDVRLARLVRSRAALELEPAVLPSELEQVHTSEAALVRATHHLGSGDARKALKNADANRERALRPFAALIRVAALSKLGRLADAEHEWVALQRMDPALARTYGPTTAPGGPRIGLQVQAPAP